MSMVKEDVSLVGIRAERLGKAYGDILEFSFGSIIWSLSLASRKDKFLLQVKW